MARPQQKCPCTDRADVPTLAATYAFGLVKNHPYRDGNKRIGFLAMVTFLGMNGHGLAATDAQVVAEIVALADGKVSEDALTDWIRRHSARRGGVSAAISTFELRHGAFLSSVSRAVGFSWL